MNVDVGNLKHRLSVFGISHEKDENKIQRELLVHKMDLWCSVKKYNINDSISNGIYTKQKFIGFYIRANIDVAVNDIIKFDNSTFAIKNIEDLAYENRLFLLECEER